MKLKKYLEERHSPSRREERGETTKTKGHKHDYDIQRLTGDGGTSYDAGHLHKIKAMVVQPAEDFKDKHIHELGEPK